MKKARIHPLVLITCVFASLLVGFFAGRNTNRTPVHIQEVPPLRVMAEETQATETNPEPSFPININTATWEQLQALPGIGPTYAQRIIDYREEHGPFRTVGELMNISGIGEKRLEAIWDLVTTGG